MQRSTANFARFVSRSFPPDPAPAGEKGDSKTTSRKLRSFFDLDPSKFEQGVPDFREALLVFVFGTEFAFIATDISGM